MKESEKNKEPEQIKDDANPKGVDESKLTEAELQKIEDDLLAQEGARTWRDEAAEEFLAKQNAKTIYIPGQIHPNKNLHPLTAFCKLVS